LELEESDMTEENNTLSGTWYCWHWYPSKDDTAEDTSKNRMEAYQKDDELVLQSEANEEGSYMFIRLRIDDDVATGAWHESTSRDGDFAGAEYSGAGQLLFAPDRQSMEGMWSGVGLDRGAQKKRVYGGRWKLSRTDE
jgi:hypothetical protein